MNNQNNIVTNQSNNATQTTLEEIIKGLQNKPTKTLPSKFLYDKRGSELFHEITKLEEYYVPKCEVEILKNTINDLNIIFPKNLCLIEYGSGNSIKTRMLLDSLKSLQAYIPIDVSKEYLSESAKLLQREYPHINITPLCEDYCKLHSLTQLPINLNNMNILIYFSGSSIGNLHKEETLQILRNITQLCSNKGKLLIGIDIKKPPHILHRAYNDSQGITAQFNLNILRRLNKDFNATFNLDNFCHYAFYNIPQGRVEMHLVSLKHTSIEINNTPIVIREGESIWTESSYKYTPKEFIALAKEVQLDSQKLWTDKKKLFSIHLLTPNTYNEQ